MNQSLAAALLVDPRLELNSSMTSAMPSCLLTKIFPCFYFVSEDVALVPAKGITLNRPSALLAAFLLL